MKHTILCINSGSSSIKFALYQIRETEQLLAHGAVERIGLPGGWLCLKDPEGRHLEDRYADYANHNVAVTAMFVTAMKGLPVPEGVGHRRVHGGPDDIAPEILTPELMPL